MDSSYLFRVIIELNGHSCEVYEYRPLYHYLRRETTFPVGKHRYHVVISDSPMTLDDLECFKKIKSLDGYSFESLFNPLWNDGFRYVFFHEEDRHCFPNYTNGLAFESQKPFFLTSNVFTFDTVIKHISGSYEIHNDLIRVITPGLVFHEVGHIFEAWLFSGKERLLLNNFGLGDVRDTNNKLHGKKGYVLIIEQRVWLIQYYLLGYDKRCSLLDFQIMEECTFPFISAIQKETIENYSTLLESLDWKGVWKEIEKYVKDNLTTTQ
jgi:hypothetical protein